MSETNSNPTARPRPPRNRTLLVVLVGLLLLFAAFAALFVHLGGLPEGVVPIAWDKEPCAHCRMHVGDPSFATQVQTKDGVVANFDDPGCMFEWLKSHSDPIHGVWLHHHREDRWLSREQAGFVAVDKTPMGFGIGVVDRNEPSAMDWEAAVSHAKAHRHHGGGH